MIDGKKVLAWIPARGGSKGIKNKNIKNLNGKPLISYTIQAALSCSYVDKVLVSTDSAEIASIANMYGADTPFLRPSYLATDTSKTIDAVMHTLHFFKDSGSSYDIFCLLQPTSPLRTSEDIERSLELFVDNSFRSLVSVNEARSHPVMMRKIDKSGRLLHLVSKNSTVRRQELEKIYEVNGSIYINLCSEINKGTSFNDNEIPFVMATEHAIDIDTNEDFIIAEAFLTCKREKK